MRRRVWMVMAVVLSMVATVLSVGVAPVRAEPDVAPVSTGLACVVGGSCYSTIQEAVVAASPGDTVTVSAGTYSIEPQPLRIGKAVTIMGPNADVPAGGDRFAEAVVKTALLVDAADVTISGLTIDGTGVSQTQSLMMRGVLVANTGAVARPTITNNVIQNWVTGISLAGGGTPGWVADAVITGNTLINNGIGSTENATGLVIKSNAFVNGGVGLGGGATLKEPLAGNTFSQGTGGYVGVASGVLSSEQTITAILAENTFDRAAAVSAATGQWYSSAISVTIGGAVAVAANGATITVAAGTYTESVTVNKRLTILGPNADVSPVTGAGWGTRSEAVVTGSGDYATFIFSEGSSGSVLRGITIQESAGGNSRAGVEGRNGAEDVLIQRNRFVVTKVGVYASAPGYSGLFGWLIDDNLVEAGVGVSDSTVGMNLWHVSDVTVSANRIVGLPRGLQFEASSGPPNARWVIADNVIEGSASRGVQIASVRDGSQVVVRGNVLTNNNWALASDSYSGALRIRGNTPSTAQFVVSGNTFTGNVGSAIMWGHDTDITVSASNATISGNTFNVPAGAYAVSYASLSNQTLNLRGNTWNVCSAGRISGLTRFLPTPTPNGPIPVNVTLDTSDETLQATCSLTNTTPASQRSGAVTLSAQTTGGAGTTVSFFVDGQLQGSASTNTSGIATLSAIVSPGTYQVSVTSPGASGALPVSLTVSARSVCKEGCDHETIQAAVNEASIHETVTVGAGTYHESVTVNKAGLVLRGDVFGQATVSGTVTIDADDVTVQGLRIKATSHGVVIPSRRASPRVIDNIIQGPTGPADLRGVLFYASGWTGTALIENNTFNKFRSAVFTQGTLDPSDLIVVRNNVVGNLYSTSTAFTNDQVGGSALYVGNTITSSQSVSGTRNGISSTVSAGPITIRGNTIMGHSGAAVNIRSNDVTVIDNHLSGNVLGVAFHDTVTTSAVTTAVIRNNDVSDNVIGVFLNVTSEGVPAGVLRAAENFWGAGVTPTVSAGVVGPTVTDLRSSAIDQVIVSPWLDAFGGRPVLQAGEILVTVTDASGNPVSGVGIAVGSAAPVSSGADGRVRVTGLQAGAFDVTITPGDVRLVVGSATRRVNVTANQAAVLDVVVVDKGVISGRITDTSGEGVPAATMTLNTACAQGGPTSATTDASGSYVFTGCSPGPFEVTMTPPSGTVASGRTSARVVLAPGSSATADFRLARIGAITGSVRDTDGRPVPNAAVGINTACSPGGATSTTTDAFGRYRFQNCSLLDTYTVTLTVPGGFVAAGVVSRLVNLAAGSSATADFTVSQTGRIGGRVVDTTGVGVAGVPVTLYGATPVETDLDGRFAFTGTTPDTYTVTLGALPAGYAPGSVNRLDVVVASGGAATADFTLIRTGGITGRVAVGALGVAGVEVSLAGVGSTTTSLDGTYQFLDRPTGRYTVSIDTPPSGYAVVGATSRVVLVASGQGARADFRLTELGAVEGRIVDETGAGIAGVPVTIGDTQVRTAPDGSYRRSGLEQGSTLAFAAEVPTGFATTSAVPPTVTVGVRQADVTLARLGTVAGFAYVDLNGNDVRDDGEPPLAGVVVTLSSPQSTASTATTSANGFYRFDQVPLGSTLSFTAPSGFQVATTTEQQANVSLLGGLRLMNGAPLATFIEDKGLLPVGTAIGYVTLNGEPLAGVTVRVDGASQFTSADGVALFSNVIPGTPVTIDVPAGFELLSTTTRPGSPVTTFALSVAGAPDSGGTTPAPPGSAPRAEVRERFEVRPVGVTPVTVNTSDGPVVLRFSGISVATGGAPEVVVRPLGYDATARGVQAAGPRFALTAERFAFDEVEVCVPVNSSAVRASGTGSDRVRLVHTRADGTEHDITTRLDLAGSTGEVCGVAQTFSTFQAAILASGRVAGEDRYDTAARTALELYPGPVSTVYIATGADFPDALAAGAAAAAADAPLLLVRRGDVPAVTRTALGALQPTSIVLVRGTNAVTAMVESQLVALTRAAVTRVAGVDRYDTAARLALRQFPNGASTVYVATGADFPDALAAGAAAARDGAALLLVPTTGLPVSVAVALSALSPQRIVVAGGTAAVSAATVRALAPHVANLERIAGVDRYDTAARLTGEAATGGTLVIATGRDFPDALVATALATRRGGSVLLVAGSIPPATTQRRAAELAPARLVVLGGVRAVTPTAELRLVRQLPLAVPTRL